VYLAMFVFIVGKRNIKRKEQDISRDVKICLKDKR
jgi:hypothetical protein